MSKTQIMQNSITRYRCYSYFDALYIVLLDERIEALFVHIVDQKEGDILDTEELALQVAIDAVKRSSEYLLKTKENTIISTKTDGSLVTNLDYQSQSIILKYIREKYPNDSFFVEECNLPQTLDCPRVWIVDPIDGTSNFACGLPFCGINVSLYTNNSPSISVTYSIFGNEYMCRIKNQPFQYFGAFRYSESSIGPVIVDVIPSDINRDYIRQIIGRFYNAHLPFRSLGSAALGIMYVILGRASAYFAPRVHFWDVAPGLHFASYSDDFLIVNLELKPWIRGEQGFGIINKRAKDVLNALGMMRSNDCNY